MSLFIYLETTACSREHTYNGLERYLQKTHGEEQHKYFDFSCVLTTQIHQRFDGTSTHNFYLFTFAMEDTLTKRKLPSCSYAHAHKHVM